MLNINNYKDKLRDICHKFHIHRLDIFGSATTIEFRPDSDIDILIEFEQSDNYNLFENYFNLKDALQDIFKRSVDIVIEHSIRNPILKKNINNTRKNIYVS